MVGTAVIPYSAASSMLSPTLHLPTTDLPSFSEANSSITGAKRLQGGQPCDQKSTKTGLSDSKTSALKLAVENSAAISFPMFPFRWHCDAVQFKLSKVHRIVSLVGITSTKNQSCYRNRDITRYFLTCRSYGQFSEPVVFKDYSFLGREPLRPKDVQFGCFSYNCRPLRKNMAVFVWVVSSQFLVRMGIQCN